MAIVNITPEVLAEKFVKIAQTVRNARWRMGEIYNQLCQLESKAAAGRRLRNALPAAEARAVLGYTLTDTNLRAMGTMASTFAEAGSVVSPDGLHAVTREDIDAFGLSPDKTARLAEALTAGKLRVKQVASLSRKARRQAEGSEKHTQTIGRLLSLLDEAENGKREPTVADIAAEIAKVDERIRKAEAKRKELQEKLIALRDGTPEETTASPAVPTVEGATVRKSRPKARHAAQPSA